MTDTTPQDLYIVDNLETLRVLADPLRTQIYELLLPAPLNVRQVAEQLGLAPSRLYYHVNLMEKHNLLRVVETRLVANMIEKVYRAAANRIELSPDLLTFATDVGQTAVTELLVGTLDATRDDLLRSLNARLVSLDQGAEEKQRTLIVSRSLARISDAAAQEFRRRLHALIQEFEAQDTASLESPEAVTNYALMVAFYPSLYYGADAPGQPGEGPVGGSDASNP